MKPKTPPRRAARPLVAAVVESVAKRLSRIEDMLIEIRSVEDLKLKRLDLIEQHLENLTASGASNRKAIARLRKSVTAAR